MAAQDVAQMVANATAAAAAAIEQASEAAAPQELAACEAAEPVRELATVCEASTAHSTQQNSASISSQSRDMSKRDKHWRTWCAWWMH